MKKIILEEYSEDWVYMQLHMFKKGVIESSRISDPIISYVKPNGIIKLKFENEREYFELFDLTSYDVDILSQVFSMYHGYEFLSGYQAREDWNEGRILEFFNDDNMELLKKISSIVYPIDFKKEGQISDLCNKLYELFRSDIDDIISSYHNIVEESITDGLKETAKEELCDIFQDEKIFNKVCFLTYYTTVDVLISLYDKHDKKSSTIYSLLKTIGHQKYVRGDYSQLELDYQYNRFDNDEFNIYVNHYLSRIVENIEESDMFLNVKEYNKIQTELSKKFKFDTLTVSPKNKYVFFSIHRIDPKTNKIELSIRHKGDQSKKVKYSLEEFYNFLYHPELNFDS